MEMTDRTIINIRYSDYFKLIYSRKGGRELQFHLNQFDPNDYWIYKSSSLFREVSIEDLYEFKYSSYILFNKNVYDREIINDWIGKLRDIGNGDIWKYLNKPFPPENIKEKIKIIK